MRWVTSEQVRETSRRASYGIRRHLPTSAQQEAKRTVIQPMHAIEWPSTISDSRTTVQRGDYLCLAARSPPLTVVGIFSNKLLVLTKIDRTVVRSL